MTSSSARPARTADVVIVGGGVTGCSIAFHLAEQGVRDVLVLERRFLAAGGTGRSVGVMRQLYPSEATSRMALHSLRVFQLPGDHRRRRGLRPMRRPPRGGPRPARCAGADGGDPARSRHPHPADRPG